MTFVLSLANDYSQGAHPRILQRFSEINFDANPGYGLDPHCEIAAQLIRSACESPQAQVRFLVGGTQTNRLVIDGLLRPFEAVVAARSAHIAGHEAGAIEASGHKVITLTEHAGKIDAVELGHCLEQYRRDENHEHMVIPGMVYISHPTEYGTLYSLPELEEIHNTCKRYRIPLYLDGARLGYGLAAEGTDVTLPDIARLAEVFYIGGTKVGALFGEALVYHDTSSSLHATNFVKQNGGLLAKGWLLGLQFTELFSPADTATPDSATSNPKREDKAIETTLYYQLGRHADELAKTLREGLKQRGYKLYYPNPTNQVFFVMPRHQFESMKDQVTLSFWEELDAENLVVRACTSWATPPEDVTKLLGLLS